MREARQTAEDDFDRLASLAQAVQHLNKHAEEGLGVSLVQFRLLRELIDLPGTSSQALARRARVHPSTLTQSIRRLDRKGFLHVATDPRDSRKKLLTVTRDGRDAVARFVKYGRALLASAAQSHPVLAPWFPGPNARTKERR